MVRDQFNLLYYDYKIYFMIKGFKRFFGKLETFPEVNYTQEIKY